jgi:hypothetical protein
LRSTLTMQRHDGRIGAIRADVCKCLAPRLLGILFRRTWVCKLNLCLTLYGGLKNETGTVG